MYSLYKNEATDSDGNLNKDYISEELTAEVVSQLLTDEAFINEMAKTDRNFAQRIYDIIADFFDKMMLRYTDNEKVGSAQMDAAVKQLQSEFDNIKKMYKKALANTEAKRGVNMTLPKKGEVMHSDVRNSKSVDKIVFSTTKTAKENLSKQIDRWIKGEMEPNEVFNFGDTPFVLKALGARDLPVIMSQNAMVKINGEKHGVSLETIRNIPDNINNPVMVFKSATTSNAFVILSELEDMEGRPVVVAMHLNKREKHFSVNRIASIYGRSNANNFINLQITNGNLVYLDKIKSQNWSQSRGLQLPKLADTNSDKNNILYKEDIVNSYYMLYGKNNDEFYSKSSVADPTENIEPPQEQTMSERSVASFELKAEVRRKLNEHIEKYGTLEKGVNPVRDVDLPKKTADDRYVRRGTRTVIESARVTDEIAEKLTEEIANGEFWTTYERSGDKKSQETAQQRLEHEGFDKLLSEWDSIVESGKKIDKQDMVNAQLLMEEAAKNGDTETVVKIVTDIAAEATRAGQLVQSMMLLKKLGAGANVYKIEQTIKKLQKDLDKKFGKKSPTLEIPKDLMEEYAQVFESEDKAGDNDHSASDAIVDKIYEEIAKQIPAKWNDKLNTWRYFAMLGNPRTHIRNMAGNMVFMPAIFAKNLISATGEGTTAAVLKMFGRQMQRTKTVKGVIKATFFLSF